MLKLLKIFLPYSLLAGIIVAIAVSNFRPRSETIHTAGTLPDATATAAESQTRCAGCGSAVAMDRAVTRAAGDRTLYYCCEHCLNRNPESTPAVAASHNPPAAIVGIDPVCQMEVSARWGFEVVHAGRSYHFCTEACRDRFARSPDDFLGDRCLVCRQPNDPLRVQTATYLGKTYRLCGDEHRRLFKADPAAYFMHTMWGIPSWMYYLSIALVLVASFGLFETLERLFGQKHLGLGGSAGAAATVAVPAADRLDLLRWPLVRALLTSRPVRFACQAVVVGLFFLIIAAGLFGNQNPALNIAPLLTWTVWWGGLVILIMFTGKAWCYVCPWDAVAGWMERLRFWRKTDEGLGLQWKWPKALRNVAVATVLFVGLTWIELGFGVTMKPRVTAYLALAMLLMAIASAFLFERKGFCRYACLVGRVSGLYAMFAGTEIRARDQAVCRGCAGKECVRGSQRAYGCPTFLFPGHLQTNTYCIQCTECLQACPHDNLALNLRPWGADLVTNHAARRDEAYLALLMLSITGFHGLTMTPNWNRLTEWLGGTLSAGPLISFSLGMAALMLAPILAYALLARLSHMLAGASFRSSRGPSNVKSAGTMAFGTYFERYAYALLPIALFYHLAHNLEHLLMEGPKVIRLLSDPFGWGWNLLGTLDWPTPPWVSLDVLWILQILLVLVGHVYSLWVAQRTAIHLFGDRRAALRSQLPMLAGMIAFSIFSLWLLKQPMEMRTSAM